MEEIIGLILFLIGGAVLVMPIIALVSSQRSRRRVDELLAQLSNQRSVQARTAERLEELRVRLELLEAFGKRPPENAEAFPAAERYAPREPAEPPVEPTTISVPLAPEASAPKVAVEPSILEQPPARPAAVPPPIPQISVASVSVPAMPSAGRASPPPAPEVKMRSTFTPPISLEHFMGAKLFAWVGGLALFLGIIFFVKLSIERGWISPALRTAIGFAIGAALVGAGVVIERRKRYGVLAHTLCATGIVVLYGVTFAAHALYHLPPFHLPLATFAMMTLITLAAFLLAVRMNAQVIAILGMLGGFLTPPLCSTGQDNPFGLFSYIALLNIGVLAVAKNKRWLHLTAIAAGGTLLMEGGWLIRFFRPSQYAIGANTWIPIVVFLVFPALFAAATWWSRRRDDDDAFPALSTLALCGGAMLTAFSFLDYGAITARPAMLYFFVLGINAIAMVVVWQQPRVAIAQPIAAALTFLHLSVWSTTKLTTELLPHALVIFLAFGLMHTGFTVVCQRRNVSLATTTWMNWTPVVTLLLFLLPVFTLDSMSLMIWPAILLVDVMVIAMAIITGSLIPVLGALALTLVAAGAWALRWPKIVGGDLLPFLVVVAGFAALFGVASSFLSRKLPKAALAPLLPISSAILPFLLLILVCVRLGIGNPSPIFGLALLLTIFLLGLSRVGRIEVLVPTALGCVLALQWAWHEQSFNASHPVIPLVWYLAFYLLFTAFPWLFRGSLAKSTLPWMTSAAAGIGSFGLVYRVVDASWPNGAMGLLPAAFAILPLLNLVFVLKRHAADNPARLTHLAWFGGAALFFITLIFPIQFEKQWITLGWALEGAALCWLFRRVPHPGLRAVGAALLAASFVRLALNPAVLAYQVRGDTPILNWQLYAYSVTALALFAAAFWLKPPSQYLGTVNLRAAFCSMAGILLFLLLNIEIADAFTPAGSRSIAFDFGGNFARDMTYTISWALFALSLLVIGFWQRNAPTRYAGVGLLGVALLKLFFHDLANIESIYRIAALIAVAIIALAASFLYQRFLTDSTKP